MNYEYNSEQGKLSIKTNYCEFNNTDSDTKDFEVSFTYELSETFDMFETILTTDDLLKNNKIFSFDNSLIFDLIKTDPSTIEYNNGPDVGAKQSSVELKYIFKLLNKEYKIIFNIPWDIKNCNKKVS